MSRSKTSPKPAAVVRRAGPPLLVVLTAPSGTGKSTVAQHLFALQPRLRFSVSHTTRRPRPGEEDGTHYHFVDDATFDEMVAGGAFAEWAHVHKQRYGTSRAEIDRLTGAGFDVLLDVDVQGARQLMESYPDAVSVFLLPPSLGELERRLVGRGTESREQLATRLGTARTELREAARFRYVVVNDEVERAAADFLSILHAERCRRDRNEDLLTSLWAELDQEEGA